jgi:hypothetical protein
MSVAVGGWAMQALRPRSLGAPRGSETDHAGHLKSGEPRKANIDAAQLSEVLLRHPTWLARRIRFYIHVCNTMSGQWPWP